MSSKWKDEGIVSNYEHDIPNMFLPESMCTNTHKVKDPETGKEKLVRVDPGQTVDNAIANSQWED